jgi:outer membrane immunogenic protein
MQTRMRWGIAGAFALLTSLADAAELPVPQFYQARPAVVIFRWTGFYGGIHAGGGGGSINEGPLPFTFGNSFPLSTFPPIFVGGASLITPFPFDVGVSGWLAGGQVGANYQSENIVIGIEAQASGAHLTGSHTCLNTVTILNVVAATNSASCSAKVDALGTLAARLGYAFDHLLVYGKFGGAFSNDHIYNTVGTLQGSTVGTLNFSANETRWGWMLGAGAEYAFTENWSAKIEYNYLGFATKSLRFTEPTGVAQMDADVREQIHLVKVGINYRWGVNTILVR